MPITLDNFEFAIEPKILQRGLEYFKHGHLASVQKIGENEFNAWVAGSDDYNVYIKFDGANIVEYECDCPYDWGDTCKHVAAVFFHFKNKGVKTTDNALSRELDSLLTSLSNEELRDYVRNKLRRDRKFRNSFLRDFESDFYEEEEEDFY